MTTLTMTSAGFETLVAPVMPFVSRESVVHALEGVRIRTEPGKVIAEAVRGNMLGMCVRPLEDAPLEFDMVIPYESMPGPAKMFDTLALEQTTTGTVVIYWSNQEGKTAISEYDVHDPSKFPNLRSKIAKALDVGERTQSAWLTAEQLRAFAVCAELPYNPRCAPLVIHPGATQHQMILVTCGDHFAGMASPASSIPSQPTRRKYRVLAPPPGDPIELWRAQLSTPEGE